MPGLPRSTWSCRPSSCCRSPPLPPATALAWRPLWWSGMPGLSARSAAARFPDLLVASLAITNGRSSGVFMACTISTGFSIRHRRCAFISAKSCCPRLARAGVILLIGFPLSSILAFETLVLFATIFHHSDLRWRKNLKQRWRASSSRPRSIGCIITAARPTRIPITARCSVSGTGCSAAANATARQMTMEIGVEGEEEGSLPDLILRPVRAGRDPASAS